VRGAPFLARQEQFPLVGSTNDVVAGWLADGTPEVCVASADEQTAGRGREGRTWHAPRGSSLLLSLGFRPTWLPPDRVWQLAAIASLAMAQAAEADADLPAGTVRLKWPNDLVVLADDGASVRKLAGVLGETTGLGSADPRAIVGIGVNTDWRRADFPTELANTMTSLRDAAADRPVGTADLRDTFLDRLEPAFGALRAGAFVGADWAARQITTGRTVDLVGHDGNRTPVEAVGVDPRSGGLVVADPSAPLGRRTVLSGEILHVRLAPPARIAAGV
jgi:BirA family biotin operon repressor/biotin-[acetyl-CoA-carboxylase] ligase